jgi:hypothetical protein
MKSLLREESACWRRYQALQKEIGKESKRLGELAEPETDEAPEPEPEREAPPPVSPRPMATGSLSTSPLLGNRRARRAAEKRDRARPGSGTVAVLGSVSPTIRTRVGGVRGAVSA